MSRSIELEWLTAQLSLRTGFDVICVPNTPMLGGAMIHRCFISFKTEDAEYKAYIREELGLSLIDKSLNEPIQSDDEEYILRKIREDYLADSTVTIHLI